jgi:hypothetical protein
MAKRMRLYRAHARGSRPGNAPGRRPRVGVSRQRKMCRTPDATAWWVRSGADRAALTCVIELRSERALADDAFIVQALCWRARVSARGSPRPRLSAARRRAAVPPAGRSVRGRASVVCGPGSAPDAWQAAVRDALEAFRPAPAFGAGARTEAQRTRTITVTRVCRTCALCHVSCLAASAIADETRAEEAGYPNGQPASVASQASSCVGLRHRRIQSPSTRRSHHGFSAPCALVYTA